MIVAIYARVSSDRQKETETISSQVQELQEFAAREGVAIDERHIYCDEGESGYYLDRPALDRLRDAARDGLIDALLVQNPDEWKGEYNRLHEICCRGQDHLFFRGREYKNSGETIL